MIPHPATKVEAIDNILQNERNVSNTDTRNDNSSTTMIFNRDSPDDHVNDRGYDNTSADGPGYENGKTLANFCEECSILLSHCDVFS